MWKLKGCRRCGGDVFIDKDEYGWYQQCLQCGHRAELQSMTEFKKQPAESLKEVVLAGNR